MENNYFTLNKKNILIVDDSKSINNLLVNSFKDYGFNCFNAFSLFEAKNILKKEEIHYILLDINLPDGNGDELLSNIDNKNIKVFILSTKINEEFRNLSFHNGIVDYIVKDKAFIHKIKQIYTTIIQLEKNKSQTILVIDDSIVIQEQLKDILENRNYRVKLALNSVDGFDIIKKDKIDLLLLDVELKNSNGIEFLQKNKTLIVSKLKIPVIVISSKIDMHITRDSIKAGAVDVIQKPYIIEEIILKIDLWIDYKRKQEELTLSTQLLEEYKDAVDESSIVMKFDKKGKITFVNKQLLKISGYLKSELIGKNFYILRHKDMKKATYEELWYIIKDKKKSWKGKFKNQKKDGSIYWIDVLIKPILDKDGDIIEFISIQNDITDQENISEYFKMKFKGSIKNLNSSLKLSIEYEKAINASSIVSRTDLEGNIIYVNDKFLEISGYKKDEVIGKNQNIIRHEDTPKELFKEMWQTIKQGKIYYAIIKNKAKNGKAYWVNATIVPIKNEHGETIEYMGIRNNITELFDLHQEIEDTQKEVIYKMGEISETRSKETGNHVKRVAEYSKLFAELYGLTQKESEVLFTASPMHDIGKVGIPDSILKKPDKLTNDEFEIMKSHAMIGYNILKGSKRKVLRAAAIVSKEHHEKYNGKGYPEGLVGEKIHIFGRITAIADVFDALASDRCYKKAWKDEEIFELLKKEKGEHFDPILVDLFFKHKDKFFKIREKYID